MKPRLHTSFLTILILLAFIGVSFGQGSTTSSLRGLITDSADEPLIGVNIVAVHEPSGSTYGTVTDENGYYNIANMRIGGPYKITTSYIGYSEAISNNVHLRLGERQSQNFVMKDAAIQLEGVEVIAKASFPGQGAGTSTQISSEDLEILPTLNRNLNDYTRLTPQAKGTATAGGFSVAGINNRFNAIYIDGAVNNDVFGLASSGTNGGQTGISPVSIDVLDQIQVVIAPYDVTLGGFAGGGINAVTKSGTNQFKGSAYYFFQNQSLAGKENGLLEERVLVNDPDFERTKLADFSQKTYGFSLGGPIKKNKAFFFVNVELQDDATPNPFNVSTYTGDTKEAGLNQLRTFLMDTYGYDAGTFGDTQDGLEGTKIFGKLDFNLGSAHKLTVRHQYTKAEQINENTSSTRRIQFSNNGVLFPSTTNSFAAELNSSLSSNASNNLLIGVTVVKDDRDPIGGDFPFIDINDGSSGQDIMIGSDQFSTGNILEQKIFTLTDNYKLYKGKHTWTFGTHNEFSDFYNLFIRQNFGIYRYSSVADFMSGAPANSFDRSYSLVDNVTGDGSAAGAEFKTLQLGIYAQDEIQINRNLRISAGLRIDVPFILTDSEIDPTFNTTTLPMLADSYDVSEAEGGKLPSGQIMLSPRIGFNYDLTGDQSTILRGGLGVFTSRIPFVWPGGAYSNNGVTIGSVDEDDIDGDVLFNPDPENQPTNPNFTVPSGQVDLFAKNFRYPQVFRASLGLDKDLGNGLIGGLEGIYTKTLNNVEYQNINSDPTVAFNWTNANGQDDRPVFTRSNIDPTYSSVYLATNTSEGYTYNLTASLAKDFTNGLSASVAYTYGNAFSTNDGLSSQNSSQWRGSYHVDGRNTSSYGVSDFSPGGRIVGTLGYKINWGGSDNISTSISMFYEGESGQTYSYVYGGSSNLNNESGSTSRNRTLVWIPADASEIALEDPAQWAALNAFIEDDAYLSGNRGQYAEKNRSRTPFESQFDLRIAQDLGITGHKIQISLDIFNFANLLNKDWGVKFNRPFNRAEGAYELVNFEGYAADGTTPNFSFNSTVLGDERFNIADRASRWRARVGIRYIFN